MKECYLHGHQLPKSGNTRGEQLEICILTISKSSFKMQSGKGAKNIALTKTATQDHATNFARLAVFA